MVELAVLLTLFAALYGFVSFCVFVTNFMSALLDHHSMSQATDEEWKNRYKTRAKAALRRAASCIWWPSWFIIYLSQVHRDLKD